MNFLCSCTAFVALITGVTFPSFVQLTDNRIQSGMAKNGDIAMMWDVDNSIYHLGITYLADEKGFTMISSNWGSCGLSAHRIEYTDQRYIGTWKE